MRKAGDADDQGGARTDVARRPGVSGMVEVELGRAGRRAGEEAGAADIRPVAAGGAGADDAMPMRHSKPPASSTPPHGPILPHRGRARRPAAPPIAMNAHCPSCAGGRGQDGVVVRGAPKVFDCFPLSNLMA